jgi:uncharacterized protein
MEQNLPELSYPVEFPIRIIGNAQPAFFNEIVAILKRHVADLDEESITTRPSNGGKYLSISAHFIANSREQMDDLYRELGAHPDVKTIL